MIQKNPNRIDLETFALMSYGDFQNMQMFAGLQDEALNVLYMLEA